LQQQFARRTGVAVRVGIEADVGQVAGDVGAIDLVPQRQGRREFSFLNHPDQNRRRAIGRTASEKLRLQREACLGAVAMARTMAATNRA
jgi:hypothetical protein